MSQQKGLNLDRRGDVQVKGPDQPGRSQSESVVAQSVKVRHALSNQSSAMRGRDREEHAYEVDYLWNMHFRLTLISLLGIYSCLCAGIDDSTWQTLSLASEQVSEQSSCPLALLCILEAEWSGSGPSHSCRRH